MSAKKRGPRKNSFARILKRWIALDYRLRYSGIPGMTLGEFARDYGVSIKTVQRDIAAFDELEFEVHCRVLDRTKYYRYADRKQLTMFAKNVWFSGGSKPRPS